MAGLLSVCVYIYAMTLMGDRPHSRLEKTGNYAYALALLVVPIYAALYLSALLAEQVALSHLAWAAPAVSAGLGVGWLTLSQLIAWRIRGRLGERDRIAKIEQLARQEVESLQQSCDLFASDHYDLSVIEAWRALEARLRQALLSRRIVVHVETPQAVLHAAVRAGILREPSLSLVEELKRNWLVALSTEPLTRDAATAALSIVRHLLAITPVKEWAPAPRDKSSGSAPDPRRTGSPTPRVADAVRGNA
jgi:hypothetical protein